MEKNPKKPKILRIYEALSPIQRLGFVEWMADINKVKKRGEQDSTQIYKLFLKLKAFTEKDAEKDWATFVGNKVKRLDPLLSELKEEMEAYLLSEQQNRTTATKQIALFYAYRELGLSDMGEACVKELGDWIDKDKTHYDLQFTFLQLQQEIFLAHHKKTDLSEDIYRTFYLHWISELLFFQTNFAAKKGLFSVFSIAKIETFVKSLLSENPSPLIEVYLQLYKICHKIICEKQAIFDLLNSLEKQQNIVEKYRICDIWRLLFKASTRQYKEDRTIENARITWEVLSIGLTHKWTYISGKMPLDIFLNGTRICIAAYEFEGTEMLLGKLRFLQKHESNAAAPQTTQQKEQKKVVEMLVHWKTKNYQGTQSVNYKEFTYEKYRSEALLLTLKAELESSRPTAKTDKDLTIFWENVSEKLQSIEKYRQKKQEAAFPFHTEEYEIWQLVSHYYCTEGGEKGIKNLKNLEHRTKYMADKKWYIQLCVIANDK